MRDVSLQEAGVVQAVGRKRHGWRPEGDTEADLSQQAPTGVTRAIWASNPGQQRQVQPVEASNDPQVHVAMCE